MMPASAKVLICSKLTCSGASVIIKLSSRAFASRYSDRSASVIGRSFAGSCAPGTAKCGPSRCRPNSPGSSAIACAVRSITRAVTSALSEISVGRIKPVPSLRCAAMIRRISAALWQSPSIRPSPPFTWRSTNSGKTVFAPGIATLWLMLATWPSAISISTPLRQPSPSRIFTPFRIMAARPPLPMRRPMRCLWAQPGSRGGGPAEREPALGQTRPP